VFKSLSRRPTELTELSSENILLVV